MGLRGNEKYVAYARFKAGERIDDLALEFSMRRYDLLVIFEDIRKAKPNSRHMTEEDKKQIIDFVNRHPEMTARQIARTLKVTYYRVNTTLKKYHYERLFVRRRYEWVKVSVPNRDSADGLNHT